MKSVTCPKVQPLISEDMVEVMTKGMTVLERSRITTICAKLDEQGEINSATAAKLLNSEQPADCRTRLKSSASSPARVKQAIRSTRKETAELCGAQRKELDVIYAASS